MMLAAAALCCMTMSLFTSCTNEDVPVPVSGKAVITVNTVALYDELNITDQMPEWLDGDLTIVDSVLIYDQAGSLLKKLGAETKNLQPLTIEANDLPNGTYTLVAWQTARNDDGRIAWFVYDEEQLSTVYIYTPYTGLYYTRALGYASATITVDDGNIEASVSPKAMGSVIELQVDNLNGQKDYTGVELHGGNEQYIIGCRLDPSLTDEERWVLEREHDWYELIGSLKDGKESYKFFTLTHGDDILFDLYGVCENDSLVWLLNGYHNLGVGENLLFYFDMDRLSYQPTYFGTYEDFPAWKADRDAGILVVDPCLDWGCNIEDVSRHINTKQWWDYGNYQLEFWEDMGWHRWYYIAYLLTEQYLFETEDGKNLLSALSICHDSTVPIDVAYNSLLKQGYIYSKFSFPDKDPFYAFISADRKTMALPDQYDDGRWEIFYQPTDSDNLQYITPANEAAAPNRAQSSHLPVFPKVSVVLSPRHPKTGKFSPEIFNEFLKR